MIEKRPFRKAFQLASVDVRFHLTIPSVRIEIGRPLTKCRQLVLRKLLDLVLDFLYAAYADLLLTDALLSGTARSSKRRFNAVAMRRTIAMVCPW